MAVIRIGADNVPEPDVVELFDHRFTVKRVTRSIQQKLEAADQTLRAIQGSETADGDTLVEAIAGGLNVLLEPNGKQTAAKTVLLRAWKADELTLDQIGQLYEAVQESAAKRPPTSPAGT